MTASGLLCLDSSSTTILVRDSISVDIGLDSINHCENNSINLDLNLTGNLDGAMVTWLNSQLDSIDNQLRLSTDTLTTSGTYYAFVVNENNCFDISNIAVEVTPPPIINCQKTSDVSCFGETTGSISVTNPEMNIGLYSIVWSDGDTTATRENVSQGNYSVTVVDNIGCESTCEITVTEPEKLIVDCQSQIVIPECVGGDDGTNALHISGGTPPYTLSFDMVNFQLDTNLLNLTAGNYTINVIDSQDCISECQFAISDPIEENCTLRVESDLRCNGDSIGQISLAEFSGDSISNLLWNTGDTTELINDLSAGIYSLSITNTKQCETVCQIELTEPEALEIDVSSTVVMSTCFGQSTGEIHLSITGGTQPYTILWSDGDTSRIRQALAAGTYNVTITDSNLCTTMQQYVISEDPNLIIDVDAQNPFCNGDSTGMISLSSPNAALISEIKWSNGETGFEIDSLAAGDYTADISYGDGCTRIIDITLDDYPTLQLTLVESQNITCFGESTGSVNIEALGGMPPYRIEWSNGQSGSTLQNLLMGDYSVTVTDSLLCQVTQSYTLTESPDIDISFVAQNPLCHGDSTGSIILSSVDENLITEISWSNGESGNKIDSLTAGNYTANIQYGDGCNRAIEVTLEDNLPLEVTISEIQHIKCFAESTGSIHLNVTGGVPPYQIVWNDGQTGLTRENLSAGNYTAVVTDALDCIANTEATLIEETTDFDLSLSSSSSCIDEIITLSLVLGNNPPSIADIDWQVKANSIGATNDKLSDQEGNNIDLNTIDLLEGEITIICTVTTETGCTKITEHTLLLSNCFYLALLKTVDGPTLVEIDEPIIFNIQVHNQGSVTAYDLLIEDRPDTAFIFEGTKNTSDVTGNPYDWTIEDEKIVTRIDSIEANSSQSIIVYLRLSDSDKTEFFNEAEIISYRNKFRVLPRDEDDDLCNPAEETDNDINDDSTGGLDNCRDDDQLDGAKVYICPKSDHSVEISACGTPTQNTIDIKLLCAEIDPDGDGDGEDTDGDNGNKVVAFYNTMAEFISDDAQAISEIDMGSIFYARLEMENTCSFAIPISITFVDIPEIPQLEQTIFVSSGDTTVLCVDAIPGMHYQWQKYRAADFVDIQGANSACLTVYNITESNNRYRVNITNENSDISCAALSTEATIEIIPDHLTCKGNLNVSLNKNCGILLGAHQLLNGSNLPDDRFTIDFFDLNNESITTSDFSDFRNQQIIYTVTSDDNQATCWGYLNLRDLTPPTLDCPETLVIPCSSNIDNIDRRISHKDNCGTSQLIDTRINLVQGCVQNQSSTHILYETAAIDDLGNKSEPCQVVINLEALPLNEVDFPSNIILKGATWDSNGNNYPDPSESGTIGNLSSDQISQQCNMSYHFEDRVFTICTNEYIVLRTWTLLENCSAQVRTQNQMIRVINQNNPQLASLQVDTSLYISSSLCQVDFQMNDDIFGIESGEYFSRQLVVKEYDPNQDAYLYLYNKSDLGTVTLPLESSQYLVEATYTNDCNQSSTAMLSIEVDEYSFEEELCEEVLSIMLDESGAQTISGKDILASPLELCNADWGIGIREVREGISSSDIPLYNINSINYFDSIRISSETDSVELVIYNQHTYTVCQSAITVNTDNVSTSEKESIVQRRMTHSEMTMDVYPNPFTDNLAIEIYSDIEQDVNVSLYALTGEIILSEMIELSNGATQKLKLDSGKLSLQSNLYMLVITGKNETISRQIVRSF